MKKNGFTFYELLLVIAIIAILSMITIPQVTRSLKVSRLKALSNDIEIVLSTIKTYCNVQEGKLSGDCNLNDIIDSEQIITNESLADIVSSDISDYLSASIELKEESWLTTSGYGTVVIEYPATKESGERSTKYNVKISSFELPFYSKDEFSDYISSGNVAVIAFIYDVNSNSQVDDDEDILMYCSFFKLNSSHGHSE